MMSARALMNRSHEPRGVRQHEDVSPEGQDPDAVRAWFTTAALQAVSSPQVFLGLASPANKAPHVHACHSHEWRLLGT